MFSDKANIYRMAHWPLWSPKEQRVTVKRLELAGIDEENIT